MQNDEIENVSPHGSNTMLAAVREILEEKSNEAIQRKNEFKGFLGLSPDQFSKEDLIMLLNVLFDELEGTRHTLNEYAKRLIV